MSPAPTPNLTPPRAPIDWRALRLWQIQPLRDAAVILAVVGVLYVGKILSLVTVPLLLALLLAYLVEPVVQAVTARRWMSRQGAALGLILAFTLVVITPAIIGAVVGTIQGATFLHRFGNNVTILADAVAHPEKPEARRLLPNEGWRHLADSLVELRLEAERARAQERQPPESDEAPAPAVPPAAVQPPLNPDAPPVDDPHEPLTAPPSRANPAAVQLYRGVEYAIAWVKANANAIGKTAISTGFTAIETVLRWISSLTMLIFGAFLTAFFFYFFCTGYGKVLEFWERLIPERKKGIAFGLLKQMDAVISGFVRGRLTICAILIGYYTLAYWLIGVPAPLILGPIIGTLALVPYAAGIGMPLAMLLIWVGPNLAGFQSEWWWIVFAPIGVSAISQVLDDYVLTPTIQGRNTGMDTPTILFASLAGAVLAGFYGLLVAIPVAACLKILLRETVWPRLREWAAGKATDPLPISRT
ncbi:MAG: AI-2E family transporter [Phycisphaerae bacterium]|nr:AI-2E family transporter [Phycisphaerae bacterium]